MNSDSEVVAWRVFLKGITGRYIIFQQYPTYWYENHPDKVEELIVRPRNKQELGL